MKIKILSYIGDYDCDDNYHQILKGCTEWEEVDADTYHKLVGWCVMKNHVTSSSDTRYAIFREDQFDYKTCVQQYVDHIDAERARLAKAAEARAEAKRLKAAKKQKLREEEELKLLAELKQKYDTKGQG